MASSAPWYRFEIRLSDLGQDPLRPVIVRRIMEFWAQENCIGLWKSEATPEVLSFCLANDQDAVTFKIGPIYAELETYFQPSRKDG